MPPIDQFDDGATGPAKDDLTPSNIKKKPKNQTAVAITTGDGPDDVPRIAAAGRGKLAEQILQLAFANGINVREDSALAEMLAKIELDSPIPSEAFLAVAEVLSYVYKANNEPNPFDAILGLDKPGTEFIMTLSKDLNDRLQIQIDRLEVAMQKLQSGEVPDLQPLEAEVSSLCNALLSAPQEDSRMAAEKMREMIGLLENLAYELKDFKAALGDKTG